MDDGVDFWQAIFFLGAAAAVLYQIIRGWQLGVARQLFNLLALAGAYIVAVCGGELALPILRPFGYPDAVNQIASGCTLAIAVFLGINAIGAILCQRTSHQSAGVVRFGFGFGGSVVGFIFAGFTLWLAALGIRLLGTVAETEMGRVRAEAAVAEANGAPERQAAVPGVVRGLASMKQSLESGGTGAVVNYVDPIPTGIYGVLRKITQLIAEPERFDRFLAYPGARKLTDHPKIAALRNDPVINQNLIAQNYFALLRNESIVRAANDPELSAMLQSFELEAALDYALQQPGPARARR